MLAPDTQKMVEGAEGTAGRGRRKMRFEPHKGATATMMDCDVIDDGALVHSMEANERSTCADRLHWQVEFSVSAT